jgi:hypothetical protein
MIRVGARPVPALTGTIVLDVEVNETGQTDLVTIVSTEVTPC